MKKIIVLFLVFIYAGNLFSQSHSTCQTAMPFCLDSTHVYPLNTTDSIQMCPDSTYHCYGCTAYLSVINPKWFWTKIKSNGNLGFRIVSVNNFGFNFVCWGPFSSNSNFCDSLTLLNIKSCNYANSPINPCSIGNVIAGQYYLICITNSISQANNIFFQQQGTGVPLTDCNLTGISNNYQFENTSIFTVTPNPFTNFCEINYQLESQSFVELTILDKFGNIVEKLVNTTQKQGKHSIAWNSEGISQGMYYCCLKTQGKILTQKIVKIK